MQNLKVEYVKIDEIKPYKNNAKLHPQEQIEQIKKSIQEFGMNDPIGIWKDEIVEGHGRLLACKELGYTEIPIIRLDHLTDEQRKAYILAHNKLTMNSDFDIDILNEELDSILDIDMSDFGFDLNFDQDILEKYNDFKNGSLQEKFIVPPFSVLDGRQGYWRERKKIWKNKIGDNGQARQNVKCIPKIGDTPEVSILDPVLSEIILKWFMPKDGSNVYDCFAGDTVFGFVSSNLGYNFTGVELRKEQVEFNQQQVNKEKLKATYICDDGRNILKYLKPASQDLFFSCPPYFDLEIYSDLENDASNQKDYNEFYKILDEAFTNSVKCLKDNRFAVIVAGDVRNKKTGEYYDFVTDIKETFKREGLKLYNELIIIDPIGTGALRANNNMKSRKMVKTHQNILVFYKGDTSKIKENFEEIKYNEEDLKERGKNESENEQF